MAVTRDEAIKKLNDLGFLTPEQLIDGLVSLGVLKLEEPVLTPMHPHLVNALERARLWDEVYPAGDDKIPMAGLCEAARLLRDVAKASK